jgi:hypothetical protein
MYLHGLTSLWAISANVPGIHDAPPPKGPLGPAAMRLGGAGVSRQSPLRIIFRDRGSLSPDA